MDQDIEKLRDIEEQPQDDPQLEETSSTSKSKLMVWLKGIGIIGFMFFLLKGIGWLFVFYFGIDKILDLFK